MSNNVSRETQPGSNEEAPPTPETPPQPGEETPPAEEVEEVEGEEGEEGEELRQSFDRGYVERLRGKSAGYRLRMKEAESKVENLQRALFTERLQRLDLVVDTDAVPYDPDLLDDSDALREAVEELLEAKPYLRKRRAGGDIGQHSNHEHGNGFSLLDALREGA